MKANDKIFEMVTDRIIKEMEQGIVPWQKPWNGTGMGCVSHMTGRPYSLINQMLLGFRAGEWLTFNQCKAEGGSVKAGEKGSFVVFWQTSWTKKVTVEDEDGNEVEKKVVVDGHPMLKYYTVFHIDQCEGIKPKHEKETTKYENDPIDEAENVVGLYFGRETCRLDVRNSDKAFYSKSMDEVVVPTMEQYEVVEEYYSTLFHEMVHSTGHKDRLDRDTLTKSAAFGSDVYSREELVAEMGSAFMMAKLGISNEKAFKNSVGYLQGWLKALQDDKKMLVVAAGRAEAAVNFILNGKAETGSN